MDMASRAVPRIFSLLGLEKDPGIDNALLEALPHLDGEARTAALKQLCERARPATLTALVVRSQSFEPSLRDATFGRFDLLHPGLRAALASEKFEDRAAAIGAIVAARDFKSAHWLAEALRSSCSRTRELAGEAIHRLTDQHVARRGAGVTPDQAGEFRFCALRLGEMHRSLIEHWESHSRIDVLEAGLWMMEFVEEALNDKVAQIPNRIQASLLKMLGGTPNPRLARFTLWALTQPALKNEAIRLITKTTDGAFIDALVEESWLLSDVQLAKAFHGVHNAAQWLGWACNPHLPENKAAAIVRMIGCAGGARDGTVNQLMAVAQHGAMPVRSAVLWQLIGNDSSRATQVLGELGARGNDPLASIAAREVRRRQLRDPSMVRRASDPTTGSHTLHSAVKSFIDEFERLTEAERAQLASELRLFGAELAVCIEDRLQSLHSVERAKTIRVLNTLRLAGALRSKVYQCAHDPDPTVKIAALHLLSDDTSPAAIRLIRESLHDPEPRVQAAAIEAMEKLGVEASSVEAKLGSKSNRVRANAIKALWKSEFQSASQELEKMLTDDSPDHRLSALWVVERLKLSRVVARLEAMARSDSNLAVRLRARRVLQSMQLPREVA